MIGWVLCQMCEGKAPLVACDACQHRGIVEDDTLGYTEEDAKNVRISFSFELPEVDLTLYEVFPDGLPDGVTLETLTAEHILKSLKECGSKSQALSEWSLFGMGDVEVHVNVKTEVKSTSDSW